MYVKVKVRAGAKTEEFKKISNDHFDVSVREPAEMNRANTKVVELIRAHFGSKARDIRIISGHHSPSKILSVEIELAS